METYLERIKILKNYKNEKGHIIKPNEYQEIDAIYQKVIAEKRYIKYNEQQKESMLTGIAKQFLAGDNKRRIFLTLSDNAHMDYFNNFMNDQADNIERALKSRGLSTDSLKHKDISHTKPTRTAPDKDGVSIETKVDKDEKGYPLISDMQIYHNGELIYNYVNGVDYTDYIEYEDKEDDITFITDNPEVLDKYQVTKSGKKRKSPVVAVEVIDDIEYTYSQWTDRYGNLRFTRKNAKTGRFA